MGLSPISALTGIASTINDIIDKNKALQFQQTIGLLSNEQQQALNQQLLSTNDANTRLQMLTSSLTQIRQQQVSDATKKQSTTLIVVSATAVMLLGILVYYYK